MSAILGLKKKLKSVRTTGKLSKAMKTVSAAKFSRLSAVWKNYLLYEEQFRFLFRQPEETKADAVVVMGSNRGFCGGFNSDILQFLRENITAAPHLIGCGEELIHTLSEAGYVLEKTFCFDDVPMFSQCEPLLDYLAGFAEGKPFHVLLVHPRYVNAITQTPVCEWLTLNPDLEDASEDDYLWFPQRGPAIHRLCEKGSRCLLYGAILETALGAQAATLMTMRSAYDTAEEYSETLQRQIQRLRQSEVTSDVLETSSERTAKGENPNG